MRYRDLRGVLATSVAVMAVAVATPAAAQVRTFDIPAQSAATGLPALAKQADIQLLVSSDAVAGKSIRAVKGRMTVDEAIRRVVSDSNLRVLSSDGRTYTLIPRDVKRPQSSLQTPVYQAAQAPLNDTDIIVTAQKTEERITDVPIAMSAFSAEALDDYKIEGGSELLRAIPNVNFSKSNFSMYNFSIRGIGTKAISAASDPAVAISFNNTPLLRNRLLESEFFDMQRVEVLRGPQGTLYGRNATAGVVNLIPAMPTDIFEGELKAETGSYKTRRLSGMLNVPLASNLSLRTAGAWTKRDGFDLNTFTGRRVNGRDLWSSRASLAWEPADDLKVSLIWQHFEEDDDRSRTGKQLCTRDEGPEQVGNSPIITDYVLRGRLSQGCLASSIYDEAAYGTPHPNSLVYVYLAQNNVTLGTIPGPTGTTRNGTRVGLIKAGDIFSGASQSRNLREIEANWDPRFKANNDVFQLNIDKDLGEKTTLTIQASYAHDKYWSTQDYHRFPTDVIFNDSTNPILIDSRNRNFDNDLYPGPTPGGILCDPQLGCSDRMVTADLSQSDNDQYYIEGRVRSELSDISSINIGANYLRFKTNDKYYVFNNLFTVLGEWLYSRDISNRFVRDCDLGFEGRECVHVERNSIENIQDEGHNYFLSDNNVLTKSYSAFGELYVNLGSDIKLTAGARLTHDKKTSSQIPSQLLLGGGTEIADTGLITGGRVNSGYPALPDIEQNWTALTGRLVLDWKPQLSFSDDTLVYLSLARGYKGGGTNPPRVDFNPAVVQYQFLPQTFKPEYVNALELGAKGLFNGGRIGLNLSAFYYDYKNYQISQIVDRIAYNENFPATSMGVEFEAVWKPSPAWKFDANLGILKTRLGKGARSIDVADRTQGDPEWMVLRPWLQVPGNCIAPTAMVEKILSNAAFASLAPTALAALCPGATRLGTYDPEVPNAPTTFQTLFGITYNPFAPYNPDTVGLNIADGGSGAPNGGRGFYDELEGNELPNAPRVTFNIGAQYKMDLDDEWTATIRGDYYIQSKSYSRVYNTKFDQLKSWSNANIALSIDNNENDFSFQIYVKNVFNKTPITDTFLNSDDVGLTTNIFTLDPRILGFSVKKSF